MFKAHQTRIGEGTFIKLNKGVVVLVDDSLIEHLSKFKWQVQKSVSNTYYIYRWFYKNGIRYKIYIHREIMNAKKGEEVDHIDNNTLNNRINNLRICNRGENAKNKSGHKNRKSKYKGVFSANDKRRQKWRSAIMVNGKLINLGRFYSESEAAKAYYEASKKYHGEYGNAEII